MLRKPSPTGAVAVFERVLAEGGTSRTNPTPVQARDAWLAFGRIRFRLPFRVPDADGMLYQYGVWTFTGEPRFHLDLTRQFAIRGSDEYVQFHCDVQFAVTDDLRALGSHDEWWFREQGGFDEWASAVRGRPEWLLLDHLVPVAVELRLDET